MVEIDVLHDVAAEAIFRRFEYHLADLVLDRAERHFEPWAPSDVAPATRLRHHTLRAVVLRDRSDVAAEAHYAAAIRIAQEHAPTYVDALLAELVTARLNRHDLAGALIAYNLRRAHSVSRPPFPQEARIREDVGDLEGAERVIRRLTASAPDSATTGTLLTTRARVLIRMAGRAAPRERLHLLRRAFDAADRGGELVAAAQHSMWETTNRTTVGLLLAAVGDVDEAALVAGEVSRCFARMGFRNRWSDALSVRVATDLPPAEGGLLAGWSRYRLRRSTSERDGYRELVLTFEHLLRCCVTWNGVAADPSSCRLAGRRLWDAAKSNVRKQFTINLTAALTDSEVGALFDARNVQAHRVNPRGDWAEHSRVLAAALIRFEHLLPTALLDETTGAIRPPLIRR